MIFKSKNNCFKFINFFALISILFITLTSCSTFKLFETEQLEDEKDKVKKNNVIKCPDTKIPRKTSFYKSKDYVNKYLLKIDRVSMICKNFDMKDSLEDILSLEFAINLNLDINNNKKLNNLKLPNIYIAIIDIKREKVLAKVLSNITLDNIKKDLINKNSLKIRYKNSLSDLNIYFGLQHKNN